MKSSVLNQSRAFFRCCGCLVAVAALLGLAGPAGGGEKQDVEITAIYLAAPGGSQTSVTPSGNIHSRDTTATPIMMLSDNPLLNGRLTWVGDFNTDADRNGVGAGTGILEVGTWDFSTGKPRFIASASGGLWITKFEVKGNMSTAYEGKVMAHGVAGEVEGMLANLQFLGGAGKEAYSGWILDPQSTK